MKRSPIIGRILCKARHPISKRNWSLEFYNARPAIFWVSIWRPKVLGHKSKFHFHKALSLVVISLLFFSVFIFYFEILFLTRFF